MMSIELEDNIIEKIYQSIRDGSFSIMDLVSVYNKEYRDRKTSDLEENYQIAIFNHQFIELILLLNKIKSMDILNNELYNNDKFSSEFLQALNKIYKKIKV